MRGPLIIWSILWRFYSGLLLTTVYLSLGLKCSTDSWQHLILVFKAWICSEWLSFLIWSYSLKLRLREPSVWLILWWFYSTLTWLIVLIIQVEMLDFKSKNELYFFRSSCPLNWCSNLSLIFTILYALHSFWSRLLGPLSTSLCYRYLLLASWNVAH